MGRRLVSADSHVMEPFDLWEMRLPAEFRDQAPAQHVKDGRRIISMEGKTVFSVKLGSEAADPARGGADLTIRQKDMDVDGVIGEVVFPTIGLFIYSIADPALALACARVYNDWAAEIFLERSDLFRPVALVPVGDVEGAVAELERAAGKGFGAVMPPLHGPADRPYSDPAYEPLWKAAEAAGVPLAMHAGTGTKPVSERGPGGAIINYLRVGIRASDTVAYLAAGGVLERHPALRFVITEAGAGWLAFACERMDEAFEEHAHWINPKLAEPPSAYVMRQIRVTFGAERAALLTREITTPNVLMWGSDYPHAEGTWPESQAKVEQACAGLAEDEIDAVTRANAAEVYGF